MKHFIKEISQNKWRLVSIALAVGLIATLFLYIQMRNQLNGSNSQEIVKKLSKAIILPDGTPKVTPLTDVQLYKTNWPDFYKDAEPGDILIQYQTSSLLYDPSKNKILNIFANGVLNKPKPTNVLRISLRFNGNEQYRALWLKRQVDEDMGNSVYQVTEVTPSKAVYKDEVIYLVNGQKKDLAMQFAKVINNSPIVDKLEPNEQPTNADIIVAFKSMQ